MVTAGSYNLFSRKYSVSLLLALVALLCGPAHAHEIRRILERLTGKKVEYEVVEGDEPRQGIPARGCVADIPADRGEVPDLR